tara:strand:+ start:1087 stop:1323 length:237 start_codon:yes stop_codon:yes gene_type:complete
MANTWITFIQKWSKDNKVKYNDAMKSPKAKTAYNKSKGKPMAGVAKKATMDKKEMNDEPKKKRKPRKVIKREDAAPEE